MTTDSNHSELDPREEQEERSALTDTPQLMRTIFGIFMVLIYVGMGVLLYLNFFGWVGSFAWVRYVMGSLFIVYGFWRGYRQAKGMG